MESVTYADTPLGRFLEQSGDDEDLVMEEHQHQGVSEDEGGGLGGDEGVAESEAKASSIPETTHNQQPAEQLASPPKPDPETQLNEQFGNTLKYNIASSSLLNYNLSDALPLYPALTALEAARIKATTPPPTAAPSQPTLSTVRPLEWGNDWHRRAESWQHRTPLENAFALGCWLVFGIISISSTVYNAPAHPEPAPSTPPTVPRAKPALPPAVLPSWHTQFLNKVDALVRASQELDLRAAKALTGIKEVECIGWGLGLSDPLPPITRLEGQSSRPPQSPIIRPRNSSPLAGSPSASPRLGNTPEPPSPLPLRARTLRATLSQSIASATQAYTNARVTLTEIETAAGFAPSPDVTEDEPVKHDAEVELQADEEVPANETAEEKDARLEREWEVAQAAKRVRKRTQRSTWNGPAGGDDSTFGGVDRSLMVDGHRLSRKPSQNSHSRLRGSVGSIGSIEVFAPSGSGKPLSRSSSLRTSVPVGQGRFASPRRRPASLGPGHIERLGQGLRDAQQASSGLGSPTSQGYLSLAEDEGEKDGLSLGELQGGLEGLHGVRRGLLWRVLGLVDKAAQKETWAEVETALADLTTALEGQSKVVAEAVETEFGPNGPGTDTFAIGAKTSNPHLRQHGLTLDISRSRPSSPYGWTPAGLSPAPTSGTRPLSLLGQSVSPLPPAVTAFAPRATTASRTSRPLSVANFAPPNVVSTLGPAAGLAALEDSNKAIGLALRSIAAKLHVVEADARQRTGAAAAGEVVDSDRLLATHDSIRLDLQLLLDEWEASRVALRSAVKPAPPVSAPLLSRSNSWNDGGLADASLASIPDVTGEGEAEAQDDTSVFSSELHTPPNAAGPVARDAVADAERGSVLPPAGKEQVFEAVAGQAKALPAGPKLSREERIRIMKERREARQSGGGAGGSPTKTRGELGGAQMVEELKDVLQLLKARSHLPKEA